MVVAQQWLVHLKPGYPQHEPDWRDLVCLCMLPD